MVGHSIKPVLLIPYPLFLLYVVLFDTFSHKALFSVSNEKISSTRAKSSPVHR